VNTDYSVDCGYLVVPEDRTQEDSPSVRLAVVIYHSYGADPAPDPVIHLAGGPGGSSLGTSLYMLRTGFYQVLHDRDVIFFDQRGTGYSQPRLDCPEREQAAPVLLEGHMIPDETLPVVLDAFTRCRDRLISQGIDLNMFNSRESAADVADLRVALGYPQVNLYGDSYGTRLALTVLRDHPEGVRSVVLDSVYPPEQNLYTSLAPNAQRAFDVFFTRCAADTSCTSTYPDLENFFYSLVDNLDANPVEVELYGHTITLTGRLLVDVLFVGLYNPDVTRSMPQMIIDVDRGDYSILRERLALYFDTGTAIGMQMSVQCREEIPFGSLEDLTAAGQGLRPQITSTFENTVIPLYQACSIWGVAPADPLENQPVTSSVPALVLAGEGDPITPPAWSQSTADNLPNSYFYQFQGMGHWVARASGCAIELIIDFLVNPSVQPTRVCQ
jgi:pimeloyl-ACP methyl ester carboxylesterase